MIQASQLRFISPTKQSRLLSVLYSIYEKPEASQHKIAANTDLSSSMVNNYIKWLKQEGLINVIGKTNRTQQYHCPSLAGSCSGNRCWIIRLKSFAVWHR
jgi:DNA-binding transcriptional regulator LsrR (DeoR family)